MERGVGNNLNCRHPATKVMAEREASLTKGRITCQIRKHQKIFCSRILQQQGTFLVEEEEKLLSTGERFGCCYLLSRPSVSLPAQLLSLLL